MDGVTEQRKYLMIGIRWVARVYGGLLAVLVLTIFIGESFFHTGDSPPNPFTQPLPVAIELCGMLTMWIGCILGWKWQGTGAILVIAGIMTFHIIEKRLWLMGAFSLFDLAGILFMFSWWLARCQRSGEIKDA